MRSGKKPTNCVPCAKRKVRCDKVEPACGNCKRRKQDVCIYPKPGEAEGERSGADAQRIETLETYIRSLGRDPIELYNSSPPEDRTQRSATTAPTPGLPTPASNQGTASSEVQDRHVGTIEKSGGLVNRNEDSTYIEAPMWYSWSGAERSQESAPKPTADRARPAHSSIPRFGHCSSTLLERATLPNGQGVSRTEGSLTHDGSKGDSLSLWAIYLQNVHPLVKIFFDWEIEPLIQTDLGRLSNGEKVLVRAIHFIAFLSAPSVDGTLSTHDIRMRELERHQRLTEDALLDAGMITTADMRVLQALIIYLLAMRNRARPSAIFSLMGLTVRIAERMGVHRDGTALGLSVVRSEERRRIWWQLQNMEISIGQLTGSISMTLYADWDARLPANLEDADFHSGMEEMPAERGGLTSMSHCLWRYYILWYQRQEREGAGIPTTLTFFLSPSVSIERKDIRIGVLNQRLSEKFIQYCDPLEPLHLYIQIGIRSFNLAARRVARQPALLNAKISEMSLKARDEFLDICKKAAEYYLLCKENPALKVFDWHTENYFQWTAFVYVVLEAHHRYDRDEVQHLWTLIQKIYTVHPELAIWTNRPETAAIAELTFAAWQKRMSHQMKQHERGVKTNCPIDDGQIEWIKELCRSFGLPQPSYPTAEEPIPEAFDFDAGQFLPPDFDFDVIDWSLWQDPQSDMVNFTSLQ